MYNFIFNNPTKIYFGNNQLEKLPLELEKYGKKVLLCYGGGSIKKIGLYDRIIDELKKNKFEIFEFSGIEPNPRVTSVNAGAKLCKDKNIDVILAVGGGSVIDCVKFISAGAFYDGDSWDLVIGKSPIKKALPFVTVLTLAATGSEMNCGGVISNLETNDKIGGGSPLLYPKVSFLAPENTYTVSPYQTACGGVDILSHIMESYFNTEGSMYFLDSFMESMMKTVIKYTPIAIKNPTDEEARANLMWVSSWAINGFARSCQRCMWSCHSIEHQLSAYYDITHGLGLAIVTPRWLRYVLNENDENNINRFVRFGTEVFGIDKNLPPIEIANKSIECLENFFFNELKLENTLTKLGIDDKYFDEMSVKATKGGVLKGFKKLEKDDIKNIYKMCL